MESNFNAFYSTVCQVCKNPPTSEAKFCSGCKLIQYCCGSHQKEDWLNHKDFCNSIKEILKKTHSDHIYKEIFGSIGQDLECWNQLRISVSKIVELFLKRPLTYVETQTLLFPPLCNFCHCYEPSKLYSCIGCNNVMYCCQEHQQSDKKHKELCRHLFLAYKIDMQRYFNQNTAYNFQMLRYIKFFKRFPDKMEYIFKPFPQQLSSEELLLSEPLSYFITLAFVIGQLNKKTLSNLTVHVVGADKMELLALEALPVLFKVLPNLSHLKIVMIGPDLPKHYTVPNKVQNNCSLYMASEQLYHDYVNCADFIHPDIIAAFNCGFCEFANEPEKDQWKNSLPVMSSFPNSSVVITSYSAKESYSDFERFCELAKNDNFDIVKECQVNPFSSLYPHRDWEIPNNGVFYVNKYFSVFKI